MDQGKVMIGELNHASNRVLDQHVTGDAYYVTPIPALTLMRWSNHFKPIHTHYRRKLCPVAQGAKQVTVADRTLEYGAGQSLVVTVDVPTLSQIVDASPERPFVGATMDLDSEIILDGATRLEGQIQAQDQSGFGLMVSNLDSQVTGSILRLLDLTAQPQGIPILYPTIKREISF